LKETFASLHIYFSAIEVDSGIKQAYQIGLVVGLLIATTLTFFPGEPWGIKYGKKNVEECSKEEDENDPQRIDQKELRSCQDKNEDTVSRQKPQELSQKIWAGDTIPKEKLEKLRIRLGLTEEQMQQAIDDARQEATTGTRRQPNATMSLPGNTTLSEKINSVMSMLIVVAVLYILNYQYKNIITDFLIRMFPKEAKMMGIPS